MYYVFLKNCSHANCNKSLPSGMIQRTRQSWDTLLLVSSFYYVVLFCLGHPLPFQVFCFFVFCHPFPPRMFSCFFWCIPFPPRLCACVCGASPALPECLRVCHGHPLPSRDVCMCVMGIPFPFRMCACVSWVFLFFPGCVAVGLGAVPSTHLPIHTSNGVSLSVVAVCLHIKGM